jgi:hypothetical protein
MEKAILKAMLEPDDSLACVLHTHLLKNFVALEMMKSVHIINT